MSGTRDAAIAPVRPVVIAVVPLYRPQEAALVGVAALAAQVDQVVLVDDGSPTDVGDLVAAVGLPNLRLLRSPENAGIAHALNAGVRVAIEQLGATLVLTSDQDSVLEHDYVERAVEAIGLLRERRIAFAAVAAGTVDGRATRGRDLGDLPFRTTRETVQSGMVLPAEVLLELGEFDESFFIDCVDTDYILRAARRGLPTVLVPACRMEHAMGDGIAVRLPFFFRVRDRRLPYHGPLRRYYITRNRVRLVGRHALRSPGWAARQTYEQLKSAIADLVWGPDVGGQLRATARGALDGVRGRGGRIPADVLARLTRPSSAIEVGGR